MEIFRLYKRQQGHDDDQVYDVQKNQDSRIKTLMELSTPRSLWPLLNDFGQGHDDVYDVQKNQDSRIQTLLESSTSRSLWHLLNDFDQGREY